MSSTETKIYHVLTGILVIGLIFVFIVYYRFLRYCSRVYLSNKIILVPLICFVLFICLMIVRFYWLFQKEKIVMTDEQKKEFILMDRLSFYPIILIVILFILWMLLFLGRLAFSAKNLINLRLHSVSIQEAFVGIPYIFESCEDFRRASMSMKERSSLNIPPIHPSASKYLV